MTDSSDASLCPADNIDLYESPDPRSPKENKQRSLDERGQSCLSKPSSPTAVPSEAQAASTWLDTITPQCQPAPIGSELGQLNRHIIRTDDRVNGLEDQIVRLQEQFTRLEDSVARGGARIEDRLDSISHQLAMAPDVKPMEHGTYDVGMASSVSHQPAADADGHHNEVIITPEPELKNRSSTGRSAINADPATQSMDTSKEEPLRDNLEGDIRGNEITEFLIIDPAPDQDAKESPNYQASLNVQSQINETPNDQAKVSSSSNGVKQSTSVKNTSRPSTTAPSNYKSSATQDERSGRFATFNPFASLHDATAGTATDNASKKVSARSEQEKEKRRKKRQAKKKEKQSKRRQKEVGLSKKKKRISRINTVAWSQEE
ncbi:hypothetical protein EK21DRAFT_114981 [Setomelanomma holmii]|uniref:Uncharacterized protein n=1 Tax=Setomelanomma holmii TaxID=210430 RepID=A0A9P4H474_9PLEO|nr:hypothetical protein EK21DRAFT_114981 [Setomelanomma holmii]